MRARLIVLLAGLIALTTADLASAQDRRTAAQRAAEIERRFGSSADPRIVGGENARPGEIPWQVAIVARDSPTSIHCGGSFVRRNIVVTAAHCVTDMIGGARAWKIVSGSVRLDDPRMVSHDITDVVMHPRYTILDQGWLDYDVAVIRVAQPFTGTTIDLLTSADNDRIAVGTLLQVSGWGRLQAGGSLPNALQKLDVPVVGRGDCNDANSYAGIITSRMLCAGFREGRRDSCNGDSGGPLTLAVGPNQRRLVGVVSFGDSCAMRDKYGVYGRLHGVRSWLDATIAQLSAI